MSKSLMAFLFVAVLGLVAVGASTLLADDAARVATPTTQPVEAKPMNSKCMVSGEDVDPKMTVVYKGVVYGFCCEDCEKKFNENPEKYIAAAAK